MHSVRFVGNEAMPEGHDFVMVQVGEDFVAFLRRDALSPQLLEQAWAAFRAMASRPPAPPSTNGHHVLASVAS